MAKFNYQDFQSSTTQGDGTQRSQVEFFGLKKNRDEAIVRFAFDSLDELEFVTVHNVSINGKYRKVNCIRELSDPVDKCPLCKAGVQLQQRVFVKLLQYDLENRDESGKPHYSSKIWERSANFAKTLQTYINEYGKLSDYVFKIIRNGEAGDMKTTYEIIPCMPQIYNPELYSKDFSAFNNYTVIGTIVINEDANGLLQIANGTYQPQTKQKSANQGVVQAQQPQLETPTTGADYTVSTPFEIVDNLPSQPQNNPDLVKPKRTYTY